MSYLSEEAEVPFLRRRMDSLMKDSSGSERSVNTVDPLPVSSKQFNTGEVKITLL